MNRFTRLVFWFIPLCRLTIARKVDSGESKREEKRTEVGQEVQTSLGSSARSELLFAGGASSYNLP